MKHGSKSRQGTQAVSTFEGNTVQEPLIIIKQLFFLISLSIHRYNSYQSLKEKWDCLKRNLVAYGKRLIFLTPSWSTNRLIQQPLQMEGMGFSSKSQAYGLGSRLTS